MRLENLREGALLALDQLRGNRFRSALTILGVVVGVATVMAMSALVGGIRASVIEGIEDAGPNNFFVSRFDFNQVRLVNHDGPPWGTNPRITPQEARRIGDLDRVRYAIGGLDLSGDFSAGGERLENVQINARDAGWSRYTKGDFVSGHDYLPSDVDASRPVVVLSRPLAERLFGPLDPVGRPVRINGRQFRVIGVFEMKGNIFADLVKHFAMMPTTTARKHLNASNDMFGIFVVPAPGVAQADAIDQVIATMRGMRRLRPGDANNFAVMRQEEMVATFNRLTGVFFVIMIALSSVALMVGGVGVVAIMMIAVAERTREIGIRKALGATRAEILSQFLIEAVTLTLIGGAIGLLIGGGVAALVQAATPIPASIPLGAVVAALLMAGIAGILFGLWPAWRASRMDPVAALRFE